MNIEEIEYLTILKDLGFVSDQEYEQAMKLYMKERRQIDRFFDKYIKRRMKCQK